MVYKLEKLRNTCVSQCARAPCVLVINFSFQVFYSEFSRGGRWGGGAGGERARRGHPHMKRSGMLCLTLVTPALRMRQTLLFLGLISAALSSPIH